MVTRAIRKPKTTLWFFSRNAARSVESRRSLPPHRWRCDAAFHGDEFLWSLSATRLPVRDGAPSKIAEDECGRRRLHEGCTKVARRLHEGCTKVARRLHEVENTEGCSLGPEPSSCGTCDGCVRGIWQARSPGASSSRRDAARALVPTGASRNELSDTCRKRSLANLVWKSNLIPS